MTPLLWSIRWGFLKNYGQLTVALKRHFAPTTSPFELQFHLQRHRQKDGETLDAYAEGLAWQAIKGFPDLTNKAQQEVITDQFIEGLCDEHVQQRLLQEAPENALKVARQLGAARAAQKCWNLCNQQHYNSGQHLRGDSKQLGEAFKVYFPTPVPVQNPNSSAQSMDADVRAVTSQRLTWPVPLGQRTVTSKGGQVVAEEEAITDPLHVGIVKAWPHKR